MVNYRNRMMTNSERNLVKGSLHDCPYLTRVDLFGFFRSVDTIESTRVLLIEARAFSINPSLLGLRPGALAPG